MSILHHIVKRKRERLNYVRTKISLFELKAKLGDSESTRNFKGAIKKKEHIRMIAEIKKASPLKGIIRTDFDPSKIASIYEEKKVDAVSVITEEDFFCGSLDYIGLTKPIFNGPLLRKDFIFDEYQLYESRVFGADAVLLIGTILDRVQAEEYLALAKELGLDVLFEVHDYHDLEKALRVNAEIIGINNRDLRTLKVDLERTFLLKKEIPPDKIIVSESGIKNKEDVMRLNLLGVDAILVGTSLMESEDIGKKIEELRIT